MQESSSSYRLRLAPAEPEFDLSTKAGLRQFVGAVQILIARSEVQEVNLQAAREALRKARPLGELNYTEIKRFYSEPEGTVTRKERRGLKELKKLGHRALDARDAVEKTPLCEQMLEVGAAVQNNRRSPVLPFIDAFQLPFLYWDYNHNAIACGSSLASNLEQNTSLDPSQIDPKPSSFWSPVEAIDTQDLYHGFNQTEFPAIEDKVWRYEAPKTSFGSCPGFDAASGDARIKIKFGETMSEPFTARIFAALGYNVEPTYYAPELKIRYDRRLFREFNLRKPIRTQIRFFAFIPAYTVDVQRHFDPFQFIAAAALKDGTRWSGAELKRRLFYHSQIQHPEKLPGNFNPEVEGQIDYLTTSPANVQFRDEAIQSIGPWDFNTLDHGERRELRGAGLLGAWLGWFDSRFENTRLKLVKTDGTTELKHFFTDLGGGLGKATGLLSRKGEAPNLLTWSFTKAPEFHGKGRLARPFRIVHYQPIEETKPFAEMTLDDARWMARQIAQFTEKQIVAALVASGFDSAQVKMFAEKLISRRDDMIRDLGLSGEIAPLRPQGANTKLNYDPAIDGPVKVVLSNGQIVEARKSNLVVRNGQVVPAPSAKR